MEYLISDKKAHKKLNQIEKKIHTQNRSSIESLKWTPNFILTYINHIRRTSNKFELCIDVVVVVFYVVVVVVVVHIERIEEIIALSWKFREHERMWRNRIYY